MGGTRKPLPTNKILSKRAAASMWTYSLMQTPDSFVGNRALEITEHEAFPCIKVTGLLQKFYLRTGDSQRDRKVALTFALRRILWTLDEIERLKNIT